MTASRYGASIPRCPHVTAATARANAPVPCDECRQFVDHDQTLMTWELARRRYPDAADTINARRDQWFAQPAPKPRTDYAATFWEANRLVGAMARTLIMILISGLILAALIVFLVHAM